MATKTGVVKPVPILKSTEGPTTRPCRLRFVNNFTYPVDVLWIDHDGSEKKYATLQPGGQSPQGTYTTHAWRVRETGSARLLGTYVGEEATVEMTPAAACLVHKGFNAGEAFGRKEHPVAWGTFQRRAEAKGIPIWAFKCVSEEALTRAAELLEHMLEHTPGAMLERLVQNKADVAVIGRWQRPSDMPMHTFLESQDADFGVRICRCGRRGVGGSWTVPTASAGEENLIMEGDAEFSGESILVHEFAHSVMSVAMNEDQRQAVISAYFNARARQLYRGACDMMTSADEYWAYGTQAWFEATLRTDVNDGMNSRARLKRYDPQLASLLEHAYGDGSWRFQQTSPRPLMLPGRQEQELHGALALLQLKAKAARYAICSPWMYFWRAAAEKSVEKAG